MKQQAEYDRAEVDEGRTDEPKVCGVRFGSSQTVVTRVAYHRVPAAA
jgi:hypothetical protein